MSAQTLPSRHIWEEITCTPSRQALCQRLRSKIGTKEAVLKTTIVLVESLSNQILVQPFWAANSKAKINPWISDEKIVSRSKLQVKAPRNVPRWFRKIPPQAAWLPTTKPSVLTFIQGGEGAFQNTVIISLKRRWWGATEKAYKMGVSESKQWPADKLPLNDITACNRTLAEWIDTTSEDNRRECCESQIICRVWITAATRMSMTWEEHLVGTHSIMDTTETRSITQFSLPPIQVQSSTSKGHQRNKCTEVSSDLIQKLQTETLTQPLPRRL